MPTPFHLTLTQSNHTISKPARVSLRRAAVLSILVAGILAQASPVLVKVNGMRTGKGFLAMSLFPKSAQAAFPSDAARATRTFYLPLNGKTEITVPIEDLEEGDYAISVMHDEESDHKMHFNLIGIPIEGFGFSNNPRVYFGPPSFERAQVHLSPNAAPSEIKMKYFL